MIDLGDAISNVKAATSSLSGISEVTSGINDFTNSISAVRDGITPNPFMGQKTFFEELGLINVRSIENLQTQHALILFTAPRINTEDADNRNITGKRKDNIDVYDTTLRNGNVLICSSLVQSVSGFSERSLKSEKILENVNKDSLNLPISSSTGSKDLVFLFNETTNSVVYKTFSTLVDYTKSVVRGTIKPPTAAIRLGMIDYGFSVYIVLFAADGRKIQHSVKLANCFLNNLSNQSLNFDKNANEQKQIEVSVKCQRIVFDEHEFVFNELYDLGILSKTQYELKYNKSKDYSYIVGSEDNIVKTATINNYFKLELESKYKESKSGERLAIKLLLESTVEALASSSITNSALGLVSDLGETTINTINTVTGLNYTKR